MMAAGVTHEHVRMLLPRYAAGALASIDAEAVRGHLADGCSECLEALFRMPIGLPREAPSGAGPTGNGRPATAHGGVRLPAPAGPASGATPSWSIGAIVLFVVAAAIAWALWVGWL